MVSPSLAGIEDDEMLWAQAWMLMTQKGIPDTGFMTAKISSKMLSVVKIHWVSEQNRICCLDLFNPGG